MIYAETGSCPLGAGRARWRDERRGERSDWPAECLEPRPRPRPRLRQTSNLIGNNPSSILFYFLPKYKNVQNDQAKLFILATLTKRERWLSPPLNIPHKKGHETVACI